MEAPFRALSGREDLVQQARGARAGLGHVDVRIGAIGNEPVRVLHHRARDVGVQVEARHHGHAIADHLAHAAQQLAFAVVVRLDHHGAVQVQVNTIDRQRGFQSLNEFFGNALERVRGYVRRRAGGAPKGSILP